MKKLPNRMKIKKNMFKLYHELLSKISDIEFIETDLNKITPWMVDVIIKNKKKRLELINFLDKQGVQTRIFYPPIHRLSPYKKSDKTFPLTSLLSDQGLWLPSSVNLTNEQIIFITKKIKQFFK